MEVIGSKRGGTGRRSGGMGVGAVEDGEVGACSGLGGAADSLMRLMTFSESCEGEWDNVSQTD